MKMSTIHWGVLVLCVGILVGCGKPAATRPAASSAAAADTEFKLPIVDTPITLTDWVVMDGKAAATLQSYSEMESYQELARRTGITLNFIHPPIGQETQSFNLLLASGRYPDILEYGYFYGNGYPGGGDKAIQDGVLIELNDLIDKYAPNYKAYLAAHPEYAKQVTTDSGKIFAFGEAYPDDASGNPHIGRIVWGFQFRKDWLDKAGLSVPTNINEWYTVLKALKAAYPKAVPFTCRRSLDQYGLNTLTGAFGIHYGWYNDNGTIKYGPAQPEYLEYLTTMAQWYKEGLIDPDFPLNDGTAVDAKVLAGGAGGWVGLLMGGMGRYLQTAKAQGDMTFDVVGAPFPTDLKTGQAYDFLLKNEAYFGTAITTANKYPVETIKLLDYAFSAEGAQLLSYGIEGKTFTMVNGRPTFTDEILKNPQGWVIDNALAHYARTCATFIWFINDPWAQVQRMLYPQQEEAAKIWSLGTTVRTLPMLNPQENEVDTFASDMNQIQTYADEMFVKFIMGQEPLSNFPRYVANLNNMNIARVTDIQQRAYQRYSTRAID